MLLLVSTYYKTKSDTGVQQIFNTGTDTTIYINPDNIILLVLV